ncbi:hypothetical protein [Nocardioides convexus]|nr:hypothetical protein [Nocardioides convexus]
MPEEAPVISTVRPASGLAPPVTVRTARATAARGLRARRPRALMASR